MGDFSNEFRNIGEILTLDRFGSRDAGHLIQPVLDDLATAGGIAYFPPGTYRIGPPADPHAASFANAEAAPALYVPEKVTLMFAPGALLLPRRAPDDPPGRSEDIRIEIRGTIDAGLTQIFGTAWTAGAPPPLTTEGVPVLTPVGVDPVALPAGTPAPVSGPVPTGRVVLTSDRIAAAYPEWWGAVGQPRGDTNPILHGLQFGWANAAALNAAFEAAFVTRDLRNLALVAHPVALPTGAARPAIPILLGASYAIAAPIVVRLSRRADGTLDPRGFVLRGAHEIGSGSSGNRTLACQGALPPPHPPGPGFPGPESGQESAMLVIAGVSRFLIQNVTFEGNGVAETCVRVEGSADGTPCPRNAFVHCAFFGAQRHLVHVGAGPLPLAYLTAGVNDRLPPPVGEGNDDLSGLSFTACRFVPNDLWHAERKYVPVFYPIANPFAQAVVLRAARSVGIRFRRCGFGGNAWVMIQAYGGTFELTACTFQNQMPPFYLGGQGAIPRGLDIFIARPPTASGAHLAPAAFTATQVESQSWQFLATFEGWAPVRAVQNTVLNNVHAAAAPHSRLSHRLAAPDPAMAGG
jgi:hypothetical protein